MNVVRRRPQGAARVVLGGVIAWVVLLIVVPVVGLVAQVSAAPAASFDGVWVHGGVDALFRSLLLAAVAVVVGALTGVAGGIVLARQRFVGKAVLDGVLDLPLAMSPVVVGVAWLVLFGRGGWLAPLASAAHLPVLYALPGLVIATVFVTLPFFAREVALVLREIGAAEEEAAATLGATPWQAFRLVTLPHLGGALHAGTVLTVSRALGEFGAVLVLGGAIDGRTQTATTFVHAALEQRLEPAAYGLSLVLAAVTMAVAAAFPAGHRAADPERTP